MGLLSYDGNNKWFEKKPIGNSLLENKCKARSGSERAVVLNILFTVYLAVASHEHARLADVIGQYLLVTDVGWVQCCPKLFRDVSRVQGPGQQWNAHFWEWRCLRGHLRMLRARSRLMIVNYEIIMKHPAIPENVLP